MTTGIVSLVIPTANSYGNDIARISLALGSEEPHRRVIVVLVGKLDASGTDKTNQIITMAGYVGLLPAWSEFEILAKKVRDDAGVRVLHAKEFYDTKGDFEGWSLDKKRDFIRNIHNVSLRRLELGICFSVVKSGFLEAKRKHKVAHNESAFGYCFRSVVYELLNDPVISSAVDRGENLTFVLESGDANAADAQRIFNWIKKQSPILDQALYSFGFADKKSSIGLQWADFLAVTTRRYADKYQAIGGFPEEPEFISILRDRIHLIDRVAETFFPVPTRGRRP